MKNLATVAAVSSMVKNDTLLIEVGGSLRRIKLSDLAKSIQTNQLDLSLIAWGTYLKETSDTQWGVCGNQTKWNEFKSSLGRYLLTNDGRMAKLSRSNSSVFEDGTTVDESKGHVMFHTPHRLYYLVSTMRQQDATFCGVLLILSLSIISTILHLAHIWVVLLAISL